MSFGGERAREMLGQAGLSTKQGVAFVVSGHVPGISSFLTCILYTVGTGLET